MSKAKRHSEESLHPNFAPSLKLRSYVVASPPSIQNDQDNVSEVGYDEAKQGAVERANTKLARITPSTPPIFTLVTQQPAILLHARPNHEISTLLLPTTKTDTIRPLKLPMAPCPGELPE